ncbi:MAG: peroxiredoxin-like family protein, partial [Burkholderiaceae bacterium]
RQPAPRLDVPTVGHGRWALADRHPAHFSLIVFYRGAHCPICRGYLTELNRLVAEFEQRGVEVVAVSTDDAVRAAQTVRDGKLDALAVGYGLSIETARSWGLYISTGRGKTSTGVEEPPKFAEPGVFLIRPDGSAYFASVQSMPFARPHLPQILSAIDYVLKNDYPARGEA